MSHIIEDTKKLYRRYAPAYDIYSLQNSWQGPSTVVQPLRPFLRSGDRILELGCGTGQVMQEFHKAAKGLHITGIDVSPDMLEICRDKGVADKLVLGDINRPLPFEDSSFKFVVSVGVVSEHIPDLSVPSLVIESARVLCPGGAMVWGIRVPHLDQISDNPLDMIDRMVSMRGQAISRMFSNAGLNASFTLAPARKRSDGNIVNQAIVMGLKAA